MTDHELTRGANNVIMTEPREGSNEPERLAFQTGQPEMLLGGNRSRHHPSINYEPVGSADVESRINNAFDILFEEVMSIRKQKQDT